LVGSNKEGGIKEVVGYWSKEEEARDEKEESRCVGSVSNA
jgi:hypothetical protein